MLTATKKTGRFFLINIYYILSSITIFGLEIGSKTSVLNTQITNENVAKMGTEVQWLQLAPLDLSERKEPPGSGPCVKEARLIHGSAWLRSVSWPPFCFLGVDPTSPTIWLGLGWKSEGLWRETYFQIQAHRFQVDSTNSPRINLVTLETFRSSSVGVSSIWCARIPLLRSRRFESRTEPSRNEWNLNAALKQFLPQTSPTTNPFKIPFQPFICLIV